MRLAHRLLVCVVSVASVGAAFAQLPTQKPPAIEPAPKPSSRAATPIDICQQARVDWQSVQSSTSISVLEAYLKQTPQSCSIWRVYAEEALVPLREKARAAEQAAAAARAAEDKRSHAAAEAAEADKKLTALIAEKGIPSSVPRDLAAKLATSVLLNALGAETDKYAVQEKERWESVTPTGKSNKTCAPFAMLLPQPDRPKLGNVRLTSRTFGLRTAFRIEAASEQEVGYCFETFKNAKGDPTNETFVPVDPSNHVSKPALFSAPFQLAASDIPYVTDFAAFGGSGNVSIVETFGFGPDITTRTVIDKIDFVETGTVLAADYSATISLAVTNAQAFGNNSPINTSLKFEQTCSFDKDVRFADPDFPFNATRFLCLYTSGDVGGSTKIALEVYLIVPLGLDVSRLFETRQTTEMIAKQKTSTWVVHNQPSEVTIDRTPKGWKLSAKSVTKSSNSIGSGVALDYRAVEYLIDERAG